MLPGVYQPQQSFHPERVGNGTRSNSVSESELDPTEPGHPTVPPPARVEANLDLDRGIPKACTKLISPRLNCAIWFDE